MRTLFLLLVFNIFTSEINSQSLPAQWRKSDDGHTLIAGDQMEKGLYNESVVEEIRLYFPQSNYWNLLSQYYNSKTDIPATLKYKGEAYDSVGVRFKGQTSYFMNNTQKKSFNISLDYVRQDQKLAGYKTLNLNNSWTDASFMREVLYYRLIRNHSPSAKANFIRLYINDQDWGIYQNVQQLNKDFLEEWYENNNGVNIRADVPDGSSTGPGGPGGTGGQWGDGTAGINYLGADTTLYQKYYTLKSSDRSDPWQQLITACNVLNNSGSNLETEAPKVFDIDKILWHMACEIAFGDDDSYVYKGKMDYYIYQDAVTNRWATYDYDANSTLLTAHVSWSPFYNASKVNYPLLNKLLAVPAFRQRYLAHMRTIINELLDESKVNALINSYDGLIRTGVFADTKKATSNAAYTNELNVLKNFIKNRKAYLLNDSEVKAASPSFYDLTYAVNGNVPTQITEEDQVLVKAKVGFGAGIQSVFLHYAEGFSGTFTAINMNDNGVDGDETAGDGTYSALLPTFSTGTMVRYYAEAVGNDTAKSRTYFPAGAEHQVYFFNVEAKTSSAMTVVINEFMATNTGIIKDEAEETEDWIELYNNTDQDIDLSGYHLTDNADNLTKFTFGDGIKIKANDYLIIWADEDGTQGPLHANFKLSAGGESILLLDKNLVIRDQVTFGVQSTNLSAARKPNGTGDFVIGAHSFGKNNDGTSATADINTKSIRIYPNPSSDLVWIENSSSTDITMAIYDLHGRKISEILSKYGSSVPVTDLNEGVYIIKFLDRYTKLVITK
jgi:CotH kinase protein/Lamin Tail Domain/Secretion system C-terminal sorting domain